MPCFAFTGELATAEFGFLSPCFSTDAEPLALVGRMRIHSAANVCPRSSRKPRGVRLTPWFAGDLRTSVQNRGRPWQTRMRWPPPGQQSQQCLHFLQWVVVETPPLPQKPLGGELRRESTENKPSSGRSVTSVHSASLIFY